MTPTSKRMTFLAVLGAAVGATVLVLVMKGRRDENQAPGPSTKTEDSVASLMTSLSAADPDARASAARHLGERGDPARLAAGRLTEVLLRDDSPRVRAAAAGALGPIGVAMVRHPPAGRAAMGVPVDPGLEQLAGALLRAAEDRDEDVRQRASEALAKVGTEALGPLARANRKDGRDMQAAADRAVASLGSAAGPILLHVLSGTDTSAWAAASHLFRVGRVRPDEPQKSALVRTCRAALVIPDPKVRESAADLLGEFGDCTPPTVAALRRTLRDDVGAVRAASASALGRLAPEDPAVIADLAGTLADKVPAVRVEVLRAIGALGTRAVAEVPALCRALKDEEAAVRVAAADALEGIAPKGPEAITPLIEVLDDGHVKVRESAARALGKFGSAAAQAVAPLLAALKKNPPPRPPTGLDGSLLGYHPPDETAPVRWAVVWALARIAPQDGAVIAAAVDALDDPNELTTSPAIETLVIIGTPAVKPLIGRLGNRDPEVRLRAVEALAALGPAAREAVGPLKAVGQQDRDDRVRAEAVDALKKIALDTPR